MLHRLLRQGQGFTAGHPQLPFHQIQPGNHLGHRMLHLQACVHFHKVETAVLLQQEFHGAGAAVVNGMSRLERGLAHGLAQGRGHAWSRRLLDHFLVAALHRAVAFRQVDAIAQVIEKYLDFHMAGFAEVFFHQHPVVAETGQGLAPGGGQRRVEFARRPHLAHAFAATAGRGLEQHGVSHLLGRAPQQGGILVIPVIAGHQRHAGLRHDVLGCGFAAHGGNRRAGRANKHHALLGAGRSKASVF